MQQLEKRRDAYGSRTLTGEKRILLHRAELHGLGGETPPSRGSAPGLPVKGNKKRAEKMLADTRKDFTIPKGQVSELSPDMAFSDYMRYWLKMMRTAVTETTYSSYCFNVEKHIIPYFEPLGVTLAGLQPRQIQSFYLHEAETLKNTSILRFHANLHKALKYAVRIDLIASNPVDKVDRPKPQAFMASYYSAEEMEKLFEAAQGHKLELIIQLAAFYGLRRAEVMGLRWEAIDFEAKTLTIRHIVTSTRIDGKKILVEADRAKTKSSLRTLPLVDPIAERLKAVKEQQEYNQKICGNCYNQEYLGYVFVDAMGNLIQPDSVTTGLSAAAEREWSAQDSLSRFAPLLRQSIAERGRTDEADSRVAGSQRYFHHSQYLRASGFAVQKLKCPNDGKHADAARSAAHKEVVI